MSVRRSYCGMRPTSLSSNRFRIALRTSGSDQTDNSRRRATHRRFAGPAAAKGPIERDQGYAHRSLGLGAFVAGCKPCPLRVEYRQEVHSSALVEGLGVGVGSLRRRLGPDQLIAALQGRGMRDVGVFRVLQGE